METHGHVVAALLEGMQGVRRSACFESRETGFRYSRCIGQGSMEVPVLWRKVVKYELRKAERKWKAMGWEILFGGGGGDDGHRFSGVRCSDNYWIFSDDREKLTWMVNDIIGEVMDLDMEPKSESLWWTSAHKAEEG